MLTPEEAMKKRQTPHSLTVAYAVSRCIENIEMGDTLFCIVAAGSSAAARVVVQEVNHQLQEAGWGMRVTQMCCAPDVIKLDRFYPIKVFFAKVIGAFRGIFRRN